MTDAPIAALRRLARLYNVQTQYYDIFGQLRQPSPASLTRILQLLGASMHKLDDAPDALRERRQALWNRCLDRVLVAWEGNLAVVKLRLPVDLADKTIDYQIRLESGECRTGAAQLDAEKAATKEIGGVRYVSAGLALRAALPLGYHRLRLAIDHKDFEALVIAAPVRAYEERSSQRSWGIFVPLYALHSSTSWGAGNYSDLEKLLDWVQERGGHAVGTLPLLPTFLDEPFEPSPYAPVSRLFWNEFYVNPTQAPEFQKCDLAKELLRSSVFKNSLEAFRSSSFVDYEQEMAARRQTIEALLHCLSTRSNRSGAEFQRFVQTHPQLEDYARFRAMTESRRQSWCLWPERQRNGILEPGDFREDARKYHLYAQWLAHEQVQALGEKARRGGPGLYLDFPLGVHTDGYDVWRHRNAFALGVSGGAPPDTFFTKGQDWGFPPFHPEGLRDQDYRYYIDSLRHHMKHSVLLRIDHVMGLHRLFWVPHGLAPTEGAYVHYRPDEFYAILNLESHRHKTGIVGENLGTVPPYVNRVMTQHGIRGMYVGQFGVHPDPARALEDPPVESVSSLNTHDTPTFAAFWEGLDISDRQELGLLDVAQSQQEQENRRWLRDSLVTFLKKQDWLPDDANNSAPILQAWLAHLANGPAEFLLVSLEDLWLETAPQNTPGTWKERPNWRRKTRHPFEQYAADPQVLEILRVVDQLRRQRRNGS